MHTYKELDTPVLLKMIPIEDAVAYYGESEIIRTIGKEGFLGTVSEDDMVDYLKKYGYKIEEP